MDMSSIYVRVVSDAIYVDKSTSDEDIKKFIQLRKMVNIPKIVIEQKNDVFNIYECDYIDVSNLDHDSYELKKDNAKIQQISNNEKIDKDSGGKGSSKLVIKGLDFKTTKANVFAYVNKTIVSKDLIKDISKYFNTGAILKKTIDVNNKPEYVDSFTSYTNIKSDNITGISRANSYTTECDVYSRTFFFPIPSIYGNSPYFTNVLLRSDVYANVNNLVYSYLESMYVNDAYIIGVEGLLKEKIVEPERHLICCDVSMLNKLPSIFDILINHIKSNEVYNNAKIENLKLSMIDTSDVYLFLYDDKNVYAFKNIRLDKSYIGDISKAKVRANESKVVLYDTDYSIVNEISGDLYIAKNLTKVFTLSKQFMYMLYTNSNMFVRTDGDYLYVPKYMPTILEYTNKPGKTVIDKEKVSLYVSNDMRTFAKVEYKYNKTNLDEKTIESIIWDNIKSNYDVIYEDDDIMIIYGKFVYSQSPFITTDVNLSDIVKLILEPTSTSNYVKGMVTIYKKSLSYNILDKGNEYLPSMFVCAYNTRSKSLYGSVYIGKTISYSLDADITYGTFEEGIKSKLDIYRYKFKVFPYLPIKLYITQIGIEQGTNMYTVSLRPFRVNTFDIVSRNNKLAIYYSLDIKSKPILIKGPVIISGDYSKIKTGMFSMIVYRYALTVERNEGVRYK